MIRCPSCGADTQVEETRPSGDTARRRRVCKSTSCGQKITTIETTIQSRDHVIVNRRSLERLRKDLDGVRRRLDELFVVPQPPKEQSE